MNWLFEKMNPLEVFVFYRVASAACLMSSHPIFAAQALR